MGYDGGNCCNPCGCSCPDFVIKRHDTRPFFRVQVEECSPTIDWTDQNLVVEVSIWHNARLKKAILPTDTSFALADNIGFEQVLAGDIIVMDRPRNPERMQVVSFDEDNKLLNVVRAVDGNTASAWKKGSRMKIFRTMNAPARLENTFEDIIDEDGRTAKDEYTGSYLVYGMSSNDTCLPGCFMLEFKLLKMLPSLRDFPGGYSGCSGFSGFPNSSCGDSLGFPDSSCFQNYEDASDASDASESSFPFEHHGFSYWHGFPDPFGCHDKDGRSGHHDYSGYSGYSGFPDSSWCYPSSGYSGFSGVSGFSGSGFSGITFTEGCTLGEGVEWARRFPVDKEAFTIHVVDSPTAEL